MSLDDHVNDMWVVWSCVWGVVHIGLKGVFRYLLVPLRNGVRLRDDHRCKFFSALRLLVPLF